MYKYKTGKPCKHGHTAARYTVSGVCTVCSNGERGEDDPKKWRNMSRKAKDARYAQSAKGQRAKRRYREKYPKRAWAQSCISRIKIRAQKHGIPFDLTSEYLETIIPDACPVFGTPFKFFGNKKIRDTSPNVDRLVPELGYIEGNVVVISRKANLIKSCYTGSDVATMGKWLLKKGY